MAENNKILYLLKYLWDNTDIEHKATTSEIVEALAKQEVAINRHAIPSLIEQIQQFGVDVVEEKSSPNKYYVDTRDFELPELKLLVDAIESSKFISASKSKSLVNKIYALTSTHQAKELNRHLFVEGRVKSDNKTLYYTVDAIHTAINSKKRIRFKYVEYTSAKKKIYKHNDYVYEISPYALLWNNDNYYVLGYSERHKDITKFRVDRIEKAELVDTPAVRKPSDLDPIVYVKNIFSMYDGKMCDVKLKCDCDMMKVIIDRFGKDVKTAPNSDGGFTVDVSVSTSPTFFGWLFSFEGKIKLVSPQFVVDEYKKLLNSETIRMA